jgi:hypothetical protein
MNTIMQPPTGPVLSIKKDPSPHELHCTADPFPWPVRFSVMLSPGVEAQLAWVVPNEITVCRSCGRSLEAL